jgi:hypothetical protein
MSITVTSPVFQANQPIPRKYTEDGDNVSPPLNFADVPTAAKELALIVEDPDAPRPQPWIHWVICKLPAGTQSVPDGVGPDEHPWQFPSALQGKNSWGTIGYRGPAPPRGHGVHRYHFRVFALRGPIAAGGPMTSEELRQAMQGLIIAQGDLVGTYERQK